MIIISQPGWGAGTANLSGQCSRLCSRGGEGNLKVGSNENRSARSSLMGITLVDEENICWWEVEVARAATDKVFPSYMPSEVPATVRILLDKF